MHKFIIERNLPNAGTASPQELAAISGKSLAVLREMGPDIQWLESFVTTDKIYCIYVAKSADLVREHAKRGGFPADVVNEIRVIIDPTTAQLG